MIGVAAVVIAMTPVTEVVTSVGSDGGAVMEMDGLGEVGEKVNVDEEVKAASPWKKPEDGSGAVAEAPVMGMESWPALDEARLNGGGAGAGGGQAAAERDGPPEGASSPLSTPVSTVRKVFGFLGCACF